MSLVPQARFFLATMEARDAPSINLLVDQSNLRHNSSWDRPPLIRNNRRPRPQETFSPNKCDCLAVVYRRDSTIAIYFRGRDREIAPMRACDAATSRPSRSALSRSNRVLGRSFELQTCLSNRRNEGTAAIVMIVTRPSDNDVYFKV